MSGGPVMEPEQKQAEVKPKRQRKTEIIPAPEPEVRLGSLAIWNPKELVGRATELASVLADVIIQQNLFVVIQKRKYVKAEGWLTLGALLGVVPIEDYCRPLPDGKGFEAKINLIRAKDQGLVGSASAECTYNEKNWTNRDSYSLRSMALTRATGKAFRLSFGWIVKLCGYEATPAEEMFEPGGTQEQADAVAKEKIQAFTHAGEEKAAPKANGGPAKPIVVPTMFLSWPKAQEGKMAFVTGLTAIKQFGLKAYIEREAKGIWLEGDQGFMVPAEQVPELKRVAGELQCPIHEQAQQKAK